MKMSVLRQAQHDIFNTNLPSCQWFDRLTMIDGEAISAAILRAWKTSARHFKTIKFASKSEHTLTNDEEV